jgi:hypothetical protein
VAPQIAAMNTFFLSLLLMPPSQCAPLAVDEGNALVSS